MSPFTVALVSFLILRAPLVAAHGSAGGMMGMMLPYFHFTPGDIVWFNGWVPQSAGAMVGTCIGMVLLGLVDRWVAVCASLMSGHWHKRAQISHPPYHPVATESRIKSILRGTLTSNNRHNEHTKIPSFLYLPPFVPSHDIPRGIIQVGQSALKFALMLAVMTYNVGIILSIIVGLGVGEMLFGRFAEHELL